MNKKKFYITTAIDYVNGAPHIGHALEKIQADAMARYQRIVGKNVFFLTGVDEHGSKIMRSAQEQGKETKDFVDENTEKFKQFAKTLNLSNDGFIRTSDQKQHWPGAQLLWQKLEESNDIYKKKYRGHYCVGCETFVTERDLVDGKCPDHDREPELIEEENYFFKLSKYSTEIKSRIESDEIQIIPQSRKNEVLAMIERGIEDVSFSRPTDKISWGIPVPNDDSQMMYVWCDALSNYISAIGYGTNNNFNDFWPADIHVIGKDIIRFHTIIWPGMLLSAGLPLPKKIFAHGFITSEGKKMSKSLGNVIDPLELIKKYGVEALRYYLLREITPFEDGDLTKERFNEAYTANLVNGLGNLTSRILKMSETHIEGSVEISDSTIPGEFKSLVENFELNKAMDLIWQKISELDLLIQETQPFKLVKENKEKAVEIIKDLVVKLYNIANLLESFLPETSQKIKEAIKINKKPEEPLFPRIEH